VTAWRTRLTEMRAQSTASAGIYADANSANSANRSVVAPPAKAIGAIGANGTGIDLAKRVESPLRAAEGTARALAGPEIGEVDHDDAEHAAMAEFYAAPATVPPTEPGLVYCFPCGQPVLPRDRTWSETGGWCCATCCPAAPRVLNVKQGEIPLDAVYIGRASRGRPASKWQNPFRIGRDGTRDECIAQYEAFLCADPELMAALPELRGRALVCWCAPQACHGDLLLKLANPKVVR
jgi:hypothetical protein